MVLILLCRVGVRNSWTVEHTLARDRMNGWRFGRLVGQLDWGEVRRWERYRWGLSGGGEEVLQGKQMRPKRESTTPGM
jgi:hypothetical protein